jgi:chloramphenicol-sensitive protein RarD
VRTRRRGSTREPRVLVRRRRLQHLGTPIFWKLIELVPADQIIAHRIVWSFLLLAFILMPRRRTRPAGGGSPVRTGGVVGLYSVAAMLIALNWFVYVWAVNHGYILETSLGYFITPLVNVLLGVVVLGERLRRLQWVAVALAAAGVAYLTLVYGDAPWIAIALAVSFGTYGLVKKKAPLGSVLGLSVETGLLFVPALVYLAVAEMRGTGAFLAADTPTRVLIAAAGPVTTLPLVLFAAAVQRVPLSAIGILQFIAPTIQFVLGTVVYREPFSSQQLIGFVLVWAAVIVFGAEGLVRARYGSTGVLSEAEVDCP